MASETVAIVLGVLIPLLTIIAIIIVVFWYIKCRKKFHKRRKDFKEVSFKDNPALTGKFPETPRTSTVDDGNEGYQNNGYVTRSISRDESETSFTIYKKEELNVSYSCNGESETRISNCVIAISNEIVAADERKVKFDEVHTRESEYTEKSINNSHTEEVNYRHSQNSVRDTDNPAITVNTSKSEEINSRDSDNTTNDTEKPAVLVNNSQNEQIYSRDSKNSIHDTENQAMSVNTSQTGKYTLNSLDNEDPECNEKYQNKDPKLKDKIPKTDNSIETQFTLSLDLRFDSDPNTQSIDTIENQNSENDFEDVPL